VMVAMRFEMGSCVPYGTFLLPSYTRMPGTHMFYYRSTKRARAAGLSGLAALLQMMQPLLERNLANSKARLARSKHSS
jgi:hypothetical protein